MFGKLATAALVLALLSIPAIAQNSGPSAEFAGYRFILGETVIIDDPEVDGLFAAGSTVRAESDIAGAGFLAGRNVNIAGAIEGDAFVAGMDVTLQGPVSGDASVMGSNVSVGPIGGNLRVSAGTLKVKGPVAGDDVRLESTVSTDLYVNARSVSFGDTARVDGRLVVFEDEVGRLEIPAGIASVDRIERRNISEWEDTVSSLTSQTWQSLVRSFLVGAAVIAVLASLVAVVIPKTLADLRGGLLKNPFRNLWYGFLAESTTIGAAIVLAAILISLFAATLVGLLLIPLSLIIALVVGFAGYIVAAYALGVGLLMLIGHPEPEGMGARVLAAITAALLVSAVALIPIVGWPFALVLVLAGVGALTLKMFRPSVYAGATRTSPG